MALEIPKPSMLRNYLYEYVLIGFAVAIVFLTYALFDLNTFIRDKLMSQTAASTEAIHQSNDVLKTVIEKLKKE